MAVGGALMDASGGGMWMAAADVAKDLLGKALFGEAGPAAPTAANAGMQDMGIKSSGITGGSMSEAAQDLGGFAQNTGGGGSAPQMVSSHAAPVAPVAAQPPAAVPPPPTTGGQGLNQGAQGAETTMEQMAISPPDLDDPKSTPHNNTLSEVYGMDPDVQSPVQFPSEVGMAPIAAPTTADIPLQQLGAGPDMTGKGGPDATGGMDPMEMAAIGASLMSGIMAEGPAPPPPGLRGMGAPNMKPRGR